MAALALARRGIRVAAGYDGETGKRIAAAAAP
jgi:hypothetical protein